jgi:hypothetical protein
MRQQNRDVFPSAELLALYEPAAVIMKHDALDRRFAQHENNAARAKRSYHYLGRGAVLLVLVSAIFTLAQVFGFLPGGNRILAALMAVLGCCGLVIQFYLFVSRSKGRWLLNRFAAERLRSLKFQAFAIVPNCRDAVDLQARVKEFYSAQLVRLEMELNAGEASLGLFSSTDAIACRPCEVSANPDLIGAARQAYRELRIVYQRRFAASQIEKLRATERITTSAADFLYLSGAILTVLGLLAFALQYPLATIRLIEFLAAAAFVVGLSKTVLDNASLAEASKSRYEQFLEAIEECDSQLMQDDESFSEIVCQFERLALEELGQFCRAASHISYRL